MKTDELIRLLRKDCYCKEQTFAQCKPGDADINCLRCQAADELQRYRKGVKELADEVDVADDAIEIIGPPTLFKDDCPTLYALIKEVNENED